MQLKYAKINSTVNGNVKKGVIFSTYSALISESTGNNNKYKSRLKQLLQWCGSDFDGCIIFDECHKAKNLCPTGSSKPTKTGLTALELQNRFVLITFITYTFQLQRREKLAYKNKKLFLDCQKHVLYTHQLPVHQSHEIWHIWYA